jgi:DNA-binding transcriptional ArsR family regulator
VTVVPDAFLEDVARCFALLGDPTRLKIVSTLHEHGELPVGEIAAAAATTPANASQHLQRLAAGGVVGRRRHGQTVCYRIVDDTIEQLCALVCGNVARKRQHMPDTTANTVLPPGLHPHGGRNDQ